MRNLLIAALFAAAIPATLQAQYSSGGGSYSQDNCSGSYSSSFGSSRTLSVIGLTSDQRLVCFNEFSPQDASTIGVVSGLSGGDTTLIGIDYRVQDGKLYGVGNAGGVYTINSSNAVATFVNRLTVALTGTSFGVDFNPAADRLRVISDNGQNLRHNVNAGGVTIVDGTLNYPSAAASPVAGPAAVGVTGAAYTNNDLDPSTATTLYDVDSTRDQVVIQSPANSGFLAPTGSLTVDTNSSIGFDIYSTIRNNVTVEVQALASLTVGGTSRLYSVKLPTGKATGRGGFNGLNVVDIAIPLNQL